MKLLFGLWRLIQKLPFGAIEALGSFLGWLAYYCVVPRRKIGATNLALCFPEWTPAQRRAVLKSHFQHMGKLLIEYGLCWYASAARLKSLVSYENKAILDNALAQGQRVILLYPHFTAFELGVYALNQDVPLISIYSHQKNKVLDGQILAGRHRYDNVFLLGRNEGLRNIIRQIRKTGAPFLYLPDQDFGAKDSVFVPFFNVPTATITGLSRLAKLSDAKVIPLVAIRGQDNHVTLKFYPVWENFPSEDAVADAARMNVFIEERVREFPEQYYWLHKRFKTRPSGAPSFYR